MADKGSICVYFYNEDVYYNFYRPERTQLLSRDMVFNNTNNTITSVGYGSMYGKNNSNKVVKGNVKINNNPVIREVIALNKNNQEIGRTISRISDGYFEIKTGNYNEEVSCIAIDPKISALVNCNATDTNITLNFGLNANNLIKNAKFPRGLTQNCLVNSILKIDDEQIFVNALVLGSKITQYGIPRTLRLNVVRGYNNTTAVAHNSTIANCSNLEFNHVTYAHQIGA